MNIEQLERQRDIDRKNYVDAIKINPILNTDFSAKTPQTFSGTLQNGNEKKDVQLGSTNWIGSYTSGYSIKVTNSYSSKAELNFALYGITSSNTRSVIGSWQNDISAGGSKQIDISNLDAILQKTQYTSLLVVVENDGWWFNSNIPVYYTVTYTKN
ncbi:hypothetical protein [Chryseobacterium sp. SL1]|uniref:hypothetical protein n=1 Tax=Chryseobacterium sp. SL1 TaxID=2995159 RepID=UPI002275CA7F|nr:hypothetical protein [Chryseobacterium sp. SL1]MCY1660949.1 hypothetical protein [Chryseobacterium sp. SL1]